MIILSNGLATNDHAAQCVADWCALLEMELRPMTEYAILVPTTYNDGRPVPEPILEDIAAMLASFFGGWTKHGLVTGEWTDPETGQTYRDQSQRYTVATDQPELVAMAARRIAQLTAQLTVYTARVADQVQFVPNPELVDDPIDRLPLHPGLVPTP